MLVFYRKGFRAGVMKIVDMKLEDKDGKKEKVEVIRIIRAKDKGKEIEVYDEAFVKAKYPTFFHSKEQYKKIEAELKAHSDKRKAEEKYGSKKAKEEAEAKKK